MYLQYRHTPQIYVPLYLHGSSGSIANLFITIQKSISCSFIALLYSFFRHYSPRVSLSILASCWKDILLEQFLLAFKYCL